MSYARSPRPLCSITIGIRPRPCGALMFASSIRCVDAIVVRRAARHAICAPSPRSARDRRRVPSIGRPCGALLEVCRGPCCGPQRAGVSRRSGPSVRRTSPACPRPCARASTQSTTLRSTCLHFELARGARASHSASARRHRAARNVCAASSHQRLHLLGLRVQLFAADDFGDDEPERDALLGAAARNISGDSFDVLGGFMPCLRHVRRPSAAPCSAPRPRPATFGTANSALRRSADSTCSLHLRLDLALQLEPEVRARSRLCSSSTLPLAMPNAWRTRRRPRRQRRPRSVFTVSVNSACLAGDFLAVVIGGKRERERPSSRRLHAGHRGLELREHRGLRR